MVNTLQTMDEVEGLRLVYLKCVQNDSFGSLMHRLLSSLSICGSDFNEGTASQLVSCLDGIIVCLRRAERLRGQVFESLLDFFKGLTNSLPVIVVVDSAIPIERLDPRVQFDGSFDHVAPLASADVLFKRLYERIWHSGFEGCIISPSLCKMICDQVSVSNVPLCRIIGIMRYIMFYMTQSSPLHLDRDKLLEQFEPFGIGTSGLEAVITASSEGLQHAKVMLEVLALIPGSPRTRYEWIQDILTTSDFGATLSLDLLFTSLEGLNPDEAVRILQRMKGKLAGFRQDLKLVERLLEVCGRGEAGMIRSQEEVVGAREALREIICETNLLNIGSEIAPWIIFDDAEALVRIFFPDTAKDVLLALKHPERYLLPKLVLVPKKQSRSKAGTPTATYPDTCRLYLLILEWQRLVNLHDLYFQFQSQIHAGPRKPVAAQQTAYMARFMQSVNELELVGIWTPMGRKRDTYERRNLLDSLNENFL